MSDPLKTERELKERTDALIALTTVAILLLIAFCVTLFHYPKVAALIVVSEVIVVSSIKTYLEKNSS